MIETSIKKLRDPFILVENGVYYAYGTGVPDMTDWNDTVYACFKNVSGKLDGEWTRLPQIYLVMSSYTSLIYKKSLGIQFQDSHVAGHQPFAN